MQQPNKTAYSYCILEQDDRSRNKHTTMANNKKYWNQIPTATSVLHYLFSSNLKYPSIMKEKEGRHGMQIEQHK